MIELSQEQAKTIKTGYIELLEDAGYTVNKDSMEANLKLWAKNKEAIYSILSSSPDFDKDKMAIIFDTEVSRFTSQEFAFKVLVKYLETNHRFETDENRYISFVVSTLISEMWGYCKNEPIVNNNLLERFNSENVSYNIVEGLTTREGILKLRDEYYDLINIIGYIFKKIKLRVGQPINKIINKIFTECGLIYGLGDLWNVRNIDAVKGVNMHRPNDLGMDYYYTYEQMFALVSDLCKPKTVKKRFVISINPNDYLNQSPGDSFGSCHTLSNHGCYHGGIINMMVDTSSVIVYEIPLDSELTDNIWNIEKKERQSLYFSKDYKSYLQNVFYPSRNIEDCEIIQKKLDSVMSTFYENNLDLIHNTIKRGCCSEQNVCFFTEFNDDITDFRCYPDWRHGKEFILSKKEGTVPSFKMGELGYQASSFELFPNRSENDNDYDCLNIDFEELYCEDCGERHNRNEMVYIEDYGWVCKDCLDQNWIKCDLCGTYERIDNAIIIGDNFYCCSECASSDGYTQCDECGDWIRDDYSIYCDENGKYYCESCSSEYLIYCENCNEYHLRENAVLCQENDCWYCGDCASDLIVHCENCGETILKENAVCINGKYYCESCSEETEKNTESEEGEAE